jgi:hypothetical protein
MLKMMTIPLLKGWKFVLEKVVELLEYIINYCQAQPRPNVGHQMNDGMEEEMAENIIPNAREVGKW